ncbi:hypothetical protein [Umezawaea sp.]|uniref:hypothetical protein n=1 Tax=Umezawaea sp. TaxID=1955258 RepID=UPI002ED49DF5
MAPVHALVVSFAVSLLLGAVVDASQVEPPPRTSPTTGAGEGAGRTAVFVRRGEDGRERAVPELGNLRVRVERRSTDDVEVDRNGSFPLGGTTGWPVTVCAVLPAPWRAVSPRVSVTADGRSCWELGEPDDERPVELVVTGGS